MYEVLLIDYLGYGCTTFSGVRVALGITVAITCLPVHEGEILLVILYRTQVLHTTRLGRLRQWVGTQSMGILQSSALSWHSHAFWERPYVHG